MIEKQFIKMKIEESDVKTVTRRENNELHTTDLEIGLHADFWISAKCTCWLNRRFRKQCIIS